MTTPGSADEVIFDQLNGLAPAGGFDGYQVVRVRARVVYGGLDADEPFQFPLGEGGAQVAATPATMDAVTGASEQTSWRHIDPYGNVIDLHKIQLVQWYWFLDGCPTPLTQERLAFYQTLASRLRPWPTGFEGAMPGEAQEDYPAWPPATPTPLDDFADAADDSIDPGVVHVTKPKMADRVAGPHGGGGGGPHGGDGPHWGPHPDPWHGGHGPDPWHGYAPPDWVPPWGYGPWRPGPWGGPPWWWHLLHLFETAPGSAPDSGWGPHPGPQPGPTPHPGPQPGPHWDPPPGPHPGPDPHWGPRPGPDPWHGYAPPNWVPPWGWGPWRPGPWGNPPWWWWLIQ